ncbi:MAG: acetyl-CoA carboxylase biotin carboxyl carrier protein [Bryobacter sp.]|nr:acetyl-CoA carboxylase biotin carboxyl carrier protein [Bryobacter sp.]
MTNEEIKELIRIAHETGVAELEVQRGDNRVRIRRTNPVQDIVMPAPAPVVYAPHAAAPVAAAPAPAAADAANDPMLDPSLKMVPSPIVGTFYEAPSPGASAFVKVGDSISVGKVLCIIESMKLMNEIESEISGTIVARFVENGQPVEYGQALYAVKPN